VTALDDFRLEVFFSRWEFTARHHLTASDMETMRLADLLALAGPEELEAWQRLDLGYRPTWGDAELREAIAGTYEGVTPDHVLCFAGAQEGIACALRALLEPGDHAIVVTPNYQSPESIARSICQVSGVPLDESRGFALDLDAITAALRPGTRLIAINFPNNPTGAVADRAAFAELAELADGLGIWLFSDEVYRGIEQDPAVTLPPAADLTERALSLGVMSKAYGMPGLRVGWIACRDHSLLERIERAKHYGSICNAGPSEVLARIALRAGPQILERNRALVRDNLLLFDAFFADRCDRFEWAHPQGGCVCFPRYLGPEGAERFCAGVLEQEGVLLLPPSIYASPLCATPADRFRVGVGRRDPGPALEALGRYLAAA